MVLEPREEPHMASLPALLAYRAENCPEKVILQEVDGEGRTYAGLLDRMLRLFGGLRALGLDAGDAVAVCLPPSLVAYETWLGCASGRMIAVPFNLDYRGNMLRHALEVCQAKALVCQSRFLPWLAEVADHTPWLRTVILTDGDGAQDGFPFDVRLLSEIADNAEPATPAEWPKARDIAATIFTSGTTGPSKGVLVPWGELMTTATLWSYRNDGTDCYYSGFPMFHVTGLTPLVHMAAVDGKMVVRERFSTERFWVDVRRYNCTATLLLGTMASFLHDQPPRRDDADNPLETVLMVPLINDYQGFTQRFAVNLISLYGMTEIGWPLWSERTTPVNKDTVGRLVPGYDLRIVDEDEYPVPDGVPGQLLVRADRPWTMMQGYMNNPEATAEVWRNGWFHTGDVFVRDEQGNYYFRDRLKDTIRRRGENISSVEVEKEVQAFPGVALAAAIGVRSETTEQDVKIFVVSSEGESVDPESLYAFLCERMPRFMTPRYIEVVSELPATPTGKIRKVDLRDRQAGPGEWDRAKAGHRV